MKGLRHQNKEIEVEGGHSTNDVGRSPTTDEAPTVSRPDRDCQNDLVQRLLSHLRDIYANIGEQGSLTGELRQRVTVLSEQVHEVAMFAEKIAKTALDIDSIAFQTLHLQKKNGKIEHAMLYFDELNAVREQQNRLQACK